MAKTFPVLLAAALLACGRPSRESVTAGEIGCSPQDIWIADQSTSSGWRDSANTWVAECRGRRFVCTERSTDTSTGYVAATSSGPVYVNPTSSSETHNVSCREELQSAARVEAATAKAVRAATASAKSSPPSGAAGFSYGQPLEEAQQACESAGKAWQTASPAKGNCSGAATELGFPATVGLSFCKGRTCSITIQHIPETGWVAAFVELKQALTAKYGDPAESKAAIPGWCRSEAEFVTCLREGTLRLRITWTWPSGERINLSAGKPPQGEGDAALRVQYVKAVGLGAAASAL